MNRLFLICPTDFLERRINSLLPGKNYFITSLGNSIGLNDVVVGQIKKLIEEKKIEEIFIILKESNNIILDSGNLLTISGMFKLSQEVKNCQLIFKSFRPQGLERKFYISYLLNKRKFLLTELITPDFPELRIEVRIYKENDSLNEVFHPILSSTEIFLN